MERVLSVPVTEDLSRYLPAVEIMAKTLWQKYGRTLDGYLEFADLYHHGVTVMYEIADQYDPDRGASFRTYIGNRVYGAMRDLFFDDLTIPIYKKTKTPEVMLRLSPLPETEDARFAVELRPYDTKLQSTLMATLDAREIQIVFLRWYEDRSLVYIGDRLGLTEGRISQLLDEILPKLKRRFEGRRVQSDSHHDRVSRMVAHKQRVGGFV